MRLALTLVALLVTPATASAATVTRTRDFQRTVFAFTAGPGEANAIDVDVDLSARTVTFTDPGATITAAAPCVAAGAGVVCPTRRYLDLRFDLGDADDALELDVPTVDSEVIVSRVGGGEGDDRIDAPASTLIGGEGDDTLTSRARGANVYGGPGADTIRGRADSQRLAGGSGVDRIDGGLQNGQEVSFADAAGPVTADLRRPGLMGPTGEQDVVTRADGVIGSRFDDVLTGDASDNRFVGGDGDDVIAGGGGRDRLAAGDGLDRLRGGAGDDALRDRGERTPGAVLDGGAGDDELRAARTGAALLGGSGDDTLRLDRFSPRVAGGAGADLLFAPDGDAHASASISCGAGRDVAARFETRVVPADCERIGFLHPKVIVSIPNAVELDGGELSLVVPNLCFARCVVRVRLRGVGAQTVRMDRRKNGRASFDVPRSALGDTVTVHFEGPDDAVIRGGAVTFALV